MNDLLEKVINLVKESGFDACISFDGNKVNVINKDSELIGQLSLIKDNKMWFSVYDTDAGEIRPEGGQCSFNSDSISSIIAEFRYR